MYEAHTAALALLNEIQPIFHDRRIYLSDKTRSKILALFTPYLCAAYFAGRDDLLRTLNEDLKNPESKVRQHLAEP